MADLYRDDIHLGSYGRLAASSSVFATVTGISPVGMPTTQFTSGQPETVLRIQEIAWDVIANHPYSGVVTMPGDYDGSGTVDMADYDWWRSSFGKSISYAADGNGDGKIDAADYTVWRDNFQAGTDASGAATVPEPGLLSFMGIAATVAMIQSLRSTRKN